MNFLECGILYFVEIFVFLFFVIIIGGLIFGFCNVIGDIWMFDGKILVEIS